MATGSLDANGIWQYGEDDSEATASALLNKLASSTSDEIGARPEPGTAGFPYRMAAGVHLVAGAANVNRTLTITYPGGGTRFSVAPLITLAVQTANPGSINGLSYTSPTATGVTLVLNYTTSTALNVNYIATQMTSTTADG